MRLLHTIKACFFLIFLINIQAHAQSWDNYTPTQLGGQIPNEFLTTSTEKYLAKKEKMAISKKKRRRMSYKRLESLRLKEQFYLENIFKIDELLLSGRVLFNEPISDYVSSVGHELIKDDKRLVKKLRFYAVKSPVPNAFATDQGIIFINIGLLARLENEAQLAYILSHEITHYRQRHVMKSYMHAKNVQRKASSDYGNYQRNTAYDMMLAKSNYSRGHEMRADKAGYQLFAKSKYKLSEALGVFDILEKTQEPYDSFSLDLSRFESPLLTSAQPFLKPEESDLIEDDTPRIEIYIYGEELLTEKERENRKKKLEKLRTHPIPKKRKAAIKEIMGTPNTNGELFIISKNKFENIKKRCQFELCYLFLEKRAYYDAFYQCLLLQKQHPNSKYLKLSMAKALYGMAKYQNAKESFVHFFQYDSISTQSSELHSTLASMHPRKLTLFTLSYLNSLYQEYPTSRYLKAVKDDMLFDLFQYHLKDEYDLDNLPKSQFKAGKNIGKLLMKDDTFKAQYHQMKADYIAQRNRTEYYNTEKGQKKLKQFGKKMRKGKIGSGVNKVIVFSPYIQIFDFQDKYLQAHDNPIGYVEAEKNKQAFGKNLKTAGKNVGVEVEVLDAISLNSPHQTSRFNDIALINAWFTEQLNHSKINFFIPSNYEEVMTLGDKYGTHNFAHIGILSRIIPFRAKTLAIAVWALPTYFIDQNIEHPILVAASIVGLHIPYAMYYLVGSKYHNAVYSLVYDAKENRPIMATFHKNRKKLNNRFTTKVSEQRLKTLKKAPPKQKKQKAANK